MIRLFALSIALMALAGCSSDSNNKPEYGDSGYPSNCRAYIQESVNVYRSGEERVDDIIDGIESHCGAYGDMWGE